MPTDLAAIPLHTRASGGLRINIGTGFLARRQGVLGLVTAAHMPTKTQPRADWIVWPDRLGAGAVGTPEVSLELFSAIIPRTPRFRFRVSNEATGKMEDMMAIVGDPALEPLAEHFEVIDLDIDHFVITEEQGMTCYGFPHWAETWPPAPVPVTHGTFLGQRGRIFEANMPNEEGFSGGPVFLDDGQFAGMLIGSRGGDEDDIATIVPWPEVASLWPLATS